MNMRPIPLTDKYLGGHNLMIRPHPAVSRALILPEPASTDAGEITDKGDINHRAVLSRRANLVKRHLRLAHPLLLGPQYTALLP